MLFGADYVLADSQELEPIFADEINDGIAHAAKVTPPISTICHACTRSHLVVAVAGASGRVDPRRRGGG